MDVRVQIADAIKREDADSIRRLLRENPDQLNAFAWIGGSTWLRYAAFTGSLTSVRTLVDAGCDINLGDNQAGAAPICWAALGHEQIVSFLLSRGAKLDVSRSATNPLFWAVSHWQKADQTEIVLLLLKAGIDSKIAYPYKSKKKVKMDLDAIGSAFLWGTPRKAGVVAAWNCRGNPDSLNSVLAEAQRAALTHIAARKRSSDRQREFDEKTQQILSIATTAAAEFRDYFGKNAP
ncbi:hypothetical protein GCM10028794_27850 [Silanimonas algicola]